MTLSFSGLRQFYKDQKYFYSDELLFNLYTSLKTKPFVILSGISGTGKSKIIDIFASYYAKELSYERNYELVPVKPNWTDNRSVFGYHNIIDNTYSITPVIKLFIRALTDPAKPYFLVLDEMNLAKVEYYFSDFLSLIESRKYEYKQIANSEIDISRLEQEFGGKITLSQAIIMAALQLNSDNFETIDSYRAMSISQWWLNNSSSKRPMEQYRTELNQQRPAGVVLPNGYKGDGSRLAGRAFWAEVQGNSYKLKKVDEMDSATRKDFLEIKSIYDRFIAEGDVINRAVSITQQKISLHSSNEPLKTQLNQSSFSDQLYSQESGYYVPSEIEIPLNIFVIGTVNIDETTHMFSPKVLDRSNVIEFNDIDLYSAFEYGASSTIDSINLTLVDENITLNNTLKLPSTVETVALNKKHPEEFQILVDIFEILKVYNMHFGYRVFNEISLYIHNYLEKLPYDIDVALDNQILQKILPKLNGSVEELGETLSNLKEKLVENRFPKSSKKINEMIYVIETTGHVTFIR